MTAVVGALLLALATATPGAAAGTGAISGTVTGDGGAGLADVVVHAWVLGTTPLLDGWATTAADGTYTIAGLSPGAYVVNFRTADHDLEQVPEYYPDAMVLDGATPVTVADAPVTGIDGALTRGATITGTVSDEFGPASVATVYLYQQGGQTFGSAAQGLQPDGSFRFRRVPAGTYVIQTTGPGYRSEYYDDTLAFDQAQQLTLTAGQTVSGLSIGMTSLGSISGTVTTEAGAPIGGMPIQAWVPFRGDFYQATTAADGTYTITGVPEGEYLLQFRTWQVPGHRYEYVSEYWDDSTQFSGSGRVVVTPGQHATGIDADLELAGSIMVALTDGLGQPLSGGTVTVYGNSTTDPTWSTTAREVSPGVFLLEGLPAGSYRIMTMASGYTTEYYDDAAVEGDATLVAVANGEAAGVAVMLEWPSGIRGTVTDREGQPMAGALVSASGTSTGRTVPAAADGSYEVSLPPGTYTVVVSSTSTDPAYPLNYYPGTVDGDAATPVSVTAGAWQEGVDVAMIPYGSVAGTVTDPTGAPVEGAAVTAWADDVATSDVTGADGTFQVTVTGGSYVVEITAPDAGLLSEYYADAPDAGSATPVVVVDGETTAGIDVQLAWAATFTDVVPGQVFFREIMWLAGTHITTGYPDGSFRPGGVVTREAMAAFLHRFAGGGPSGSPTEPPAFSDVGPGNPFHDDIRWLAQEGITTGYPDGTFHPGAAVERQAMAAFLYRFMGSPTFTPPAVSPFVDVRPGDPFYAEICWLAAEGISTGTPTPSGTYFKPGAPIERQAMAAFLSRLEHLRNR